MHTFRKTNDYYAIGHYGQAMEEAGGTKWTTVAVVRRDKFDDDNVWKINAMSVVNYLNGGPALVPWQLVEVK